MIQIAELKAGVAMAIELLKLDALKENLKARGVAANREARGVEPEVRVADLEALNENLEARGVELEAKVAANQEARGVEPEAKVADLKALNEILRARIANRYALRESLDALVETKEESTVQNPIRYSQGSQNIPAAEKNTKDNQAAEDKPDARSVCRIS